jgi:TIR domain
VRKSCIRTGALGQAAVRVVEGPLALRRWSEAGVKQRGPSRKTEKPHANSRSGTPSSMRRVESEEPRLSDKYHVALSFAGEDREYVEAVAAKLQDAGVLVFYDRFEETKLWGKDLYSYLSDIYQNRALYTVMFVSKAYEKKLWTNLERKAAQARAFSESKEYILPAVFDRAVEIPGLLKTTGYIALSGLTPENFADKILKKLSDDGVFLAAEEKFSYSPDAKADVDFQLSGQSRIVEVTLGLKSHDWYTQRAAMGGVSSLDWTGVTHDQAFVLGRNIYQCACGTERTAEAYLRNLRQELAKIPSEAASHLLNGMFYEIYFSSKGEFREEDLKSERMDALFAVQAVTKYKDTIAFIRRVLSPFRDSLVVLPSTTPEIVTVRVKIARKDPPLIRSVEYLGKELLIDIPADSPFTAHGMWRLSLKQFSPETLKGSIAEAWSVPIGQLRMEFTPALREDVQLRLPKGMTVSRPST